MINISLFWNAYAEEIVTKPLAFPLRLRFRQVASGALCGQLCFMIIFTAQQ